MCATLTDSVPVCTRPMCSSMSLPRRALAKDVTVTYWATFVAIGLLGARFLTPSCVGQECPSVEALAFWSAVRGLPVNLTNEKGDSLLILAAYQEWGESCPEKLLGDFAFAIWDSKQQQLFAARDPMAMRAFYYRCEPKRLLFATEVKQILAVPGVPVEIFEPAVAAHLAGPYAPLDWTFYTGISQLPPAHALLVKDPDVWLRYYASAEDRRAWSEETDGELKYLRRYLEPQAYAHLTGFYSFVLGRSGLERSLNEVLTGTTTAALAENLTELFIGRDDRGNMVRLTIDPAVQATA